MGFTKRHVGPTFDPVKFKEIDDDAVRDFEILQGDLNSKPSQEDGTNESRPKMNRFFNLRIFQTLKRFNKKLKAVVRSFFPRRQHTPPTTETEEAGLHEEHPVSRQGSVESITPIKSTPPSLPTDTPSPDLEEDKAVVPHLEEIFSSDEELEKFVDLTPHRFKHRLPKDEPKPRIEDGHVAKLAQRLAPHFGIMDSDTSAHYGDVASSHVHAVSIEIENRNHDEDFGFRSHSSLRVQLALVHAHTVSQSTAGENSSQLFKSQLPCEEPQPCISPGHVERLTTLFAPSFHDPSE